jgi:nicotinamide mononucleotide (NMN) deamidase PncC
MSLISTTSIMTALVCIVCGNSDRSSFYRKQRAGQQFTGFQRQLSHHSKKMLRRCNGLAAQNRWMWQKVNRRHTAECRGRMSSRLDAVRLAPMSSLFEEVVEQIHLSGRQFVMAITGGGSEAISRLLTVPGASASVLEAIVPYSSRSLDEWLGGAPDQYCSEQTARAMAMRAFERARELSEAEPHLVCGIGATASLATNRAKRGKHRIHVAWQSAMTTAVASCYLKNSNETRTAEEDVSMQLILGAVAQACGLPEPGVDTSVPIDIRHHRQEAPPPWTELLLGYRTMVGAPDVVALTPPKVLFPGAFNPPHWGHTQMAEIASRRLCAPVTFELSITNVDKRPIDFIEITHRLAKLSDERVLLTRAPTFVEKARLAPGCVFIVGADTIERIADPVYYDNDTAKRDAAIAELAGQGCRFLVFGRSVASRFTTLSAVNIPAPLRAICDEVSQSEFSAEISSTELRTQ